MKKRLLILKISWLIAYIFWKKVYGEAAIEELTVVDALLEGCVMIVTWLLALDVTNS